MSSSPEAVDFSQLTPVAPPEPAPSMESAARQARALVAAAEAEAGRIRAEAFAAGHSEGFAAGRAEASVQLAPTADALAQALESVRSLEASAADRVEAEAVELAVQVAERVVAGGLSGGAPPGGGGGGGGRGPPVERERGGVRGPPPGGWLGRAGGAAGAGEA